MNIDLKLAADKAADYMDHILKLFKPGAKITVIVRSPLVPGDTDFILTDDDLTEVRAAILRQQERHEGKPASPT
jgi:hypothetical protein